MSRDRYHGELAALDIYIEQAIERNQAVLAALNRHNNGLMYAQFGKQIAMHNALLVALEGAQEILRHIVELEMVTY